MSESIKKEQKEGGMSLGRRDFFKVAGVAALGIGSSMLPIAPGIVSPAQAAIPDQFRVVLFGYDGLRVDDAQALHDEGGGGGLSRLQRPICAECGGLSSTQPGWASIMSGLPSQRNRAWENNTFRKMPSGYHIVEKLAQLFEDQNEDFYVLWVTGKSKYISGYRASRPIPKRRTRTPHHSVYELIVEQGLPGEYHGDQARTDQEVYDIAELALTGIDQYENFFCFIHFANPDHGGHNAKKDGTITDKHGAYMNAARQVDQHVSDLIDLFPSDTIIIACSDHGFDFEHRGDATTGHQWSPNGMVTANYPIVAQTNRVSQMSIARELLRLAGGNPDHTYKANGKPYRMWGESFIDFT